MLDSRNPLVNTEIEETTSTKDKINNSAMYTPEQNPSQPPKDKYGMAYFMFVMYGVAILLPWNAVLTALDFFDNRLAPFEPFFTFPFAVNCMLTFIQVLVVLFGYKLSYFLRLTCMFLVLASLMIILPLVTELLYKDNINTAFALCMVTLFIFGTVGGVAQGSLFGYAGTFPGIQMGAISFG